MECCFERLQQSVNPADLCLLKDYYENGLWLHDYELDEKGLLPRELKRGVLSQDAVYNLLEQIDTPQQKPAED
jgi:hypothetical protein